MQPEDFDPYSPVKIWGSTGITTGVDLGLALIGEGQGEAATECVALRRQLDDRKRSSGSQPRYMKRITGSVVARGYSRRH